MPHTDMPLDELRAYRPTLQVPDDLLDFWSGTLAETRARHLSSSLRVDLVEQLEDRLHLPLRDAGSVVHQVDPQVINI